MLKKRDVEFELLKIKNSTLKKDNKDSLTEIERLRGLVVKYQNANKRNSSTSLN